MPAPSSHHLDLRLCFEGGKVTLEGTDRETAPSCGFELGALLERAQSLDQRVKDALEQSIGTAEGELRRLAGSTVGLGSSLGLALKEVGRELAMSADKPYVRLWVPGDGNLAILPWEALVLPGSLRTVDLHGWQVLRTRGDSRRESRASELRRVVVLVGEVRTTADDPLTDTLRTVEAIVCPKRIERVVRVSRPIYRLDEARWEALGAEPFDSGEDLDLGEDSRATAVVVLGNTIDESGEAKPSPQRGATSIQLDREQALALPVVRTAAADRRTLADLLPPGVRLVLFLGCRTGERFAAELRAVDHVIGMRTYIPPDFATHVAREVFGALTRKGSATVGEAVRQARRALQRLGPSADSTGTVSPLWWAPAHWPAVLDDEPFLDADATLLAEYRERLRTHLEGLEGDMAQHRRSLAQVTISLQIGEALKAEDKDERWDPSDHRLAQRQPTLLDLVSEQGRARPGTWVLHGPPGSGKSTAARDLSRRLTEGSLGLIPVHVSLAHWSREERGVDLQALVSYIAERSGLKDLHAGEKNLVPRLQDALIERKERLVLVFDGLDECGNQLQNVKRLLVNLKTTFAGSALVVTTRPADYRPIPDYNDTWLMPLNSGQQQELLQRWYAGELPAAEACERAERDLATIHQKDHALRELAQVPLFLNLMGQLLLRQGSLNATRRHEFLRDMLDWVLLGKHRPTRTPFPEVEDKDPRELLRAVAYEMTRRHATHVEAEQLKSWLRHRAPGNLLLSKESACREFLREARTNGLLRPAIKGENNGAYRFWHRAFQEALAAEALWQLELTEDDLNPLLARSRELLAGEDPEVSLEYWREPFALLAGYLGNRGSEWVRCLLEDETTRSIGLAAVATAGGIKSSVLRKALDSCTEWTESQLVYEHLGARLGRGPRVVGILQQRGQRLAERMGSSGLDRGVRIELYLLVTCLDAIHERVPDAGALEAADSLLGMLGTPGDVRSAWSTVPGRAQDLWVKLPAGKFTMGSPGDEPGRDNDEEQADVSLDAFRITATTVTVAQYRLFDPEKGHPWDDEPNLPMTEVSWYEASLCCRWLDRHLGTAKWRCQLPSEAMWEYACRDGGQATTAYVNGDEEEDLAQVGWYRGNSGSRPLPVASAHQASPEYKLWDMHGNVREWCSDWFGERLRSGANPMGPPTGTWRVLRSGSFRLDARDCRSAYRYLRNPAVAAVGFGFRVVLAPRNQ
jgi:formylglycine-generating enzyme required for sulfatase activity